MHVGAAICLGGRTIGTGYNGAPAGMAHCVHELPYTPRIQGVGDWGRRMTPIKPHVTEPGCKTAVHAECNAIAYAARHGVAVAGATLYVTLSPCFSCAQLIVAAGLIRVVFDKQYRDPAGVDFLARAGLTVESMHA
jgi:dCMP deaminase